MHPKLYSVLVFLTVTVPVVAQSSELPLLIPEWSVEPNAAAAAIKPPAPQLAHFPDKLPSSFQPNSTALNSPSNLTRDSLAAESPAVDSAVPAVAVAPTEFGRRNEVAQAGMFSSFNESPEPKYRVAGSTSGFGANTNRYGSPDVIQTPLVPPPKYANAPLNFPTLKAPSVILPTPSMSPQEPKPKEPTGAAAAGSTSTTPGSSSGPPQRNSTLPPPSGYAPGGGGWNDFSSTLSEVPNNGFGYWPGNDKCSQPRTNWNGYCQSSPWAGLLSRGRSSCPTGRCSGICSCESCGPRTWLRLDVLLGWVRGYNTPPLLTQNPLGTPLGTIGDLTDPSTQIIFGDDRIGEDLRVGGLLRGGYWFDDARKLGIQGEFFSLGDDDDEIDIASAGQEILARPFINTASGMPVADARVLSLDQVVRGRFAAATTAGRVLSAAPSLRYNLRCCGGTSGNLAQRLDLLAGYRYFQLREGFRAREVTLPQGPAGVPGSSLTLDDLIDTQNDFHGFELGTAWMWQRGRLTSTVSGLVAFGRLIRRYQLDGTTVDVVPPAAAVTLPGGFLVRPENIGSSRDGKSAVLPQFRANLAYCVFRNVNFNLGYNFLYLDDVFRPGALMATTFDGNTLGVAPGPGVVGSAAPLRNESSVAVHSLSLGFSYNF